MRAVMPLEDRKGNGMSKALEKAIATGTPHLVTQVAASDVPAGTAWMVPGSFGTTYRVVLVETASGNPRVWCDCAAGKHARPCYHAAAVRLVAAAQAAAVSVTEVIATITSSEVMA